MDYLAILSIKTLVRISVVVPSFGTIHILAI